MHPTILSAAPPRLETARCRPGRQQHGFTLLELFIVVMILGLVAGIAAPQYRKALETSRFTKAKQELKLMSIAIDAFNVSHGRLPLTLYEVGHGGRRDPWGLPYCYLNYAAGTGDGLDWAVQTGIVDPSAFPDAPPADPDADPSDAPEASPPAAPMEEVASGGSSGTSGSGSSGDGSSGSSGSGSSGSGSGSSGSTPGDSGTLTATSSGGLAYDYAYGLVNNGGMAASRSVVATTEILGSVGVAPAEAASIVTKSGGNPIFLDVDVTSTRRRNQYLFPLNTDYDLFSLGPNGSTAAALNNPLATDDVIRANNGGYFGVASDY